MDATQAAFMRDGLLAKLEMENASAMAMLEHVPEDKLTFKPDDRLKPFNELAQHIYGVGIWFTGIAASGEPAPPPEGKPDPVLHLISGLVSPGADVPEDMEFYGKVRARIPGVSLENSAHLIEHMRMIKTEPEIARIEKAIAVTHVGLTDLLAAMKPGVSEFQLDGILEQSFKRQGSQHMAFPPIVGAGEQTTILHYEKKNLVVEAGQLLLLDVGAEWDHYAADISRTVPVDGTFGPEQGEIYDIVFAAQSKAIEAVKPGVTVREIHEIARDVIRDAGYIDDFIHGTSHHLGLDVHDVADYGTPLEPGMVITVEPGIYLPDRQIGVRIEDDVLVTKNGYRLLSKDIPRERKDVEAWVRSARGENGTPE